MLSGTVESEYRSPGTAIEPHAAPALSAATGAAGPSWTISISAADAPDREATTRVTRANIHTTANGAARTGRRAAPITAN